jgi:Cupin/Ku70/Ku80 beta-barrel domain
MDPLDDAFSAMRVRESLHARVEASAPWGIRFKAGTTARFGLVVAGSCWLSTEEPAKSIPLASGDCYVILDGSTYTLGDHPRSPTVNCFDLVPRLVDGAVRVGGGGTAATVVTGWFVYDELGARPLMALFPRVLHTRVDGYRTDILKATLELLAQETERPGVGSGADTGEEVASEDIIKGYKVDTDTFIEVTKEELENVALESTRTIDIDEFVDRSEIDPRYMIRPCYLTPDGKVGQKAGHFEPDKFEDQYETALIDLINQKRAGKPIVAKERPQGENVVDLMDALRKSIGGGAARPEVAKKSVKKPRKAAAGQKEMLMPIEGKKPKEAAAKKTVSKPQRKSA